MAFNKRIYDKIDERCRDDEAMADYMRRIIMYEFGESKQYTKVYEAALKECSKKSGGK